MFIFGCVAPTSPDDKYYIRFSSLLVKNIQTNLNLVSRNLVLGIYEFAWLQAVGSDLSGQQIIKCSIVTT